ncbi:MAG: dihydroorotate dehydrogenase electron transfer subunit [Dehalococcoidales bacterium]|nr:dihydroorotate dehydrogenase electron transfer subunit [Dehalococcoidales bacterium]
MKEVLFKILENKKIAKDIYEMKLSGDTSDITRPGQFIDLKLDGFYLRRPISVCDLEGDQLTIIYKILGNGTEAMTEYPAGKTVPALSGLGNGYDTALSGSHPLLIGGGVGIPPLYLLARELRKEDKKVSVILGFNVEDEIFYLEEFKKLGCEVAVTTVDGSFGIQGFVTNAIPDEYSFFYTCGPEPMLKAVYKATNTSGQFSFEARMGCGFGACMGCSCKTLTGYKRICVDGPVMMKEEILWED